VSEVEASTIWRMGTLL